VGVPRINLAETPDFDLGALRVSPAHRQVSMSGECRELEPKVAQVLIALAAASPSVVSRDRLVEQCWDGRIVGDDAVNRCIVALRTLAREFTPEPFAIETVPRVGYSLVAGPPKPPASRARVLLAPRNLSMFMIVALVLAVALAGTWYGFGRAQAPPASIAVLPFRNLSAGNSYFAEGVSEEILAQLTREPAFRVAGPASTEELKGESDYRKIGRSLGVDYVLEGSVRPGADHLRINAALVRTKDGTHVWSETYDRSPDDILQVQSAIAQAVARGLRLKLVRSPMPAAQAVNGQAYALYLNARGLLRSGDPQSGADAVTLLRQALRIDPGFAPAWARLAEALTYVGGTAGNEGLVAVIPEAQAAARRAVQLDPNLAEAHGILADVLGADLPEGFAHLQRAAELDSRTGDGLLWVHNTHRIPGYFEQALNDVQRAHDADPFASGPLKVLVDETIELADRPTAESVAVRAFSDDPVLRSFALARVALLHGDFSGAARRWAEIAKGQSRWSAPSRGNLNKLLFNLKLSKERPPRSRVAYIGQIRFAPPVWMEKPPTAAEWQNTNRSTAATLVYEDENALAAKMMLNAGRARELVTTYDSPTGLLGIRAGSPINICYVRDAATVALALRQVGRTREADALLNQADTLLRAVYGRGRVISWFEDDAAGIWALQGRSDLAINALQRAFSRGWVHAGHTDLADLAEEPALRSLRGNARFEALRAKYAAHWASERQETARILNIPA
jgi:TolB-like protein/DNA-binding winged helix-turn-helix (wHTH) protein